MSDWEKAISIADAKRMTLKQYFDETGWACEFLRAEAALHQGRLIAWAKHQDDTGGGGHRLEHGKSVSYTYTGELIRDVGIWAKAHGVTD